MENKVFFKSIGIVGNIISIIITVIMPVFSKTSANGQNILIPKDEFTLWIIMVVFFALVGMYGRIKANKKITF